VTVIRPVDGATLRERLMNSSASDQQDLAQHGLAPASAPHAAHAYLIEFWSASRAMSIFGLGDEPGRARSVQAP
jgi:hypothetical protein